MFTVRPFAFAMFATLGLSLAACSGATSGADEAPALADEGALTDRVRQGGRFETFVGEDGDSYFRLVAANNRKLLRSEGYARSSSPDATMDSLMKAAVEDAEARFKILPAKNQDGEVIGHYVNVVGAGSSREIIATSEVYSSARKAEDAAKVIRGYLKGIARVVYTPAESGERIKLFRVEDGQFKFTVHAQNGEAVLHSELYTTKDAAQKGIDAVKNYGRLGENFTASALDGGRAVVVLRADTHSAIGASPGAASNHEAVGFSEVYASVGNAERGVATVRNLLQRNLDVQDTTR